MTLVTDAEAYQKLMTPLVESWEMLKHDLLAPLHFPKSPLALLRFGILGMRSAAGLVNSRFDEEKAKALFGGLAAHSILPLDKPLTAAFGLILGILGHAVGWPIPKGGSRKIAEALEVYFLKLGGEIVTGFPITSMEDLPNAKTYLFDVTPRQLIKIAGNHLPSGYIDKLKSYRYGPGVFKLDWALSQPIPWKSHDCLNAGTVHLGATFEEMKKSEKQIWEGIPADVPFVLLAQPSLFDPSRAPPGKHTAWAYCHVPHASTVDMTDKIEAQIERFAPGFKDCILAKSSKSPLELEKYNSNYVGGDINGGVQDLYQLFTRPTRSLAPYSTPVKGLFICSSSTPPGGGVHGMCGYHAARAALKALAMLSC
ncbi:MAG: NAD(P)/FAD-dependent oxidoreductase [Parachlamydiaceae bacterium]|nr:NAD(P)/FAD-dependent oxidoreductase [Parachlamydiaceae bacterium]